MRDENFSKFVVGKVEFANTTVTRPQAFQVTVPSTVAKQEPSVPLSAIRALVQQWEEYYALRSNEQIGAFVLKRLIDQLAALCPAPHEDR